jgi:hypothetical protein
MVQLSDFDSTDFGIRVPIFETGNCEYPYSINGSCFLVRLGDFQFVVSASHVFHHENTIGTALVVPRYGYETALQFDLFLNSGPELTEQADAGSGAELDLVAARIRKSNLPGDALDGVSVWDLSESQSIFELKRGISVSVFGFPNCGKSVDYEQVSVKVEMFAAHGILGQSVFPDTIEIRDIDTQATTLQGFSGSPAFAHTSDGLVLVGMVVMGSLDSQVMHILDIRYIRQCLLAMNHEFPVECKPASSTRTDVQTSIE